MAVMSLPRATRCYKAGVLAFSRVRTSSWAPRPWMCSLGRDLAAAWGHRHFGKQAHQLGVLYNLKFANSLIEKPLEEGLAAAT